jgi:hypothetical protein
MPARASLAGEIEEMEPMKTTTRHSKMVGFALASLTTGMLALGIGCDTAPEAPKQEPATAPAPMVDSVGNPLGPISSMLAKKNAEMNGNLKLLARVEVQPNEMVEFYEGQQPGTMVVTGAGAPEGGLAIGEEMAGSVSYRTLWQKAAHGKPMPAALEKALGSLADELPRPLPTEAPTTAQNRTERHASGKAELGATEGASSASLANVPVDNGPQVLYGDQDKTGTGGTGAAGWCQNQYFSTAASQTARVYGYCDRAATDGYACRDNWWNGFWANTIGTVHVISNNVCPINGWVVLYNSTPGFYPTPISFWVAPNTVRWIFRANIQPWCVPFCNDNYFTGRMEVQQATNVSFNVRWAAYR